MRGGHPSIVAEALVELGRPFDVREQDGRGAVRCRRRRDIGTRAFDLQGDAVDGLELAEPRDRRPLDEVLQFEDLPNLDLTAEVFVRSGPWEPHRPSHRLLRRPDLDDCPAREGRQQLASRTHPGDPVHRLHYWFLSAIETAMLLLIVRYAWMWPRERDVTA